MNHSHAAKKSLLLLVFILYVGLLAIRYNQFHQNIHVPKNWTMVNSQVQTILKGQSDRNVPVSGVTQIAPININLATIDQLQALPGIGLQKAEAIAQYRDQHGGFQKLAELTKVKGIGVKTLQRLEKFVQLGP